MDFTSEPVTPMSVQIIDYDIVQGEQIQNLLQQLGFVCEYTQHAPDLLARLPATHWGCILLDVRMPYYSGIELQALLQQHDAELPIIFMGDDRDIHVAIKAFKSGAFDFLLKPLNDQIVLEVINHALRTRQKNLHQKSFLNMISSRLKALSFRETQVLKQLLEGMSNKNIAEFLKISAKTVEQHRSNIMRKMQANSFAELVTHVVKYDLINVNSV
jgi:two-component system response regulator FixJ